jgi:hypothetical protein
MQGAINREIKTDLGIIRAYESAGVSPESDGLPMDMTDPNWKSQKTARKRQRRLSNAPKAVRKRLGFKERRG